MSRLLIKHGRVVDPTQRLDEGLWVLIADGKVARVAERIEDRDAEVFDATGPGGRARFRGRPHPPARAGFRVQGNDRNRERGRGGGRLHGRLLHAQHATGQRQRGRDRVHPRPRGRDRPRPGLPDRRRLQGAAGRGAGGDGRDGAGRRGRLLGRRQAGPQRLPDAPRPRVRAAVRRPRRGPLRGPEPRGQGRHARGGGGDPPRAARDPGRRRGGRWSRATSCSRS